MNSWTSLLLAGSIAIVSAGQVEWGGAKVPSPSHKD